MTQDLTGPDLDLAIQDHIAVVTMTRAPVNAMSPDMYRQIARLFDHLSDRDDVRAVVLASGCKVFSAGADLKARREAIKGPGDGWELLRLAREAFYAIKDCRKPVIAALNGAALGAGLGLAAHCDIMVASDAASIGLPEIDVGLMGGGAVLLRLFSPSTTRRMMFTGHRLSGPELYRLGVVEACVPPEDLMEAAMAIARQIASKSPLAIRISKETINAIEEMPARESYRYEQGRTAEMANSDDAREAVAAFMEKRPAVFTGR
jgi:enoyl-CoA hydratase